MMFLNLFLVHSWLLIIVHLLTRNSASAFYHPFQGLTDKPPYLDPDGIKTGGNAFMGISLSRYDSSEGHYGNPDTKTLQTAYNLNDVADREYEYLLATNDDGWLIGGGEPGPYKLPAVDTSHITIMEMGTFEEKLGGLSQESIVEAILSGDILIPQMEVMPTEVRLNSNNPPELELLFNLEPTFPTKNIPLPINWQLRFVANQLVDYFEFPNQVVPERFHCSMTRKVSFRSMKHSNRYFDKCKEAIKKWRERGPQPLVGTDTWNYFYDSNNNDNDDDDDNNNDDNNDDNDNDADSNNNDNNNGGSIQYASGIWIYSNRQNRTKYMKPNFFPPYDSDPDKMAIIQDILSVRYNSYFHLYVDPKLIVAWSVVSVIILAFIIAGSRMVWIRQKQHQWKDNNYGKNNNKVDTTFLDECSTTSRTAASSSSKSLCRFSPSSLQNYRNELNKEEVDKSNVSTDVIHFDYAGIQELTNIIGKLN